MTPETTPWEPRKYRLSADELCIEDFDRAADTLGDTLGADPDEILSGENATSRQRLTLIIWCLKSRHVPDLTWEQAKKVPLGDFRGANEAEDVPPPPPPGNSASNGSQPGKNAAQPLKPAPAGSEPAPSAAPSTG